VHLKTQPDEMPALNLTSMIDILFLLIIFFMVATRFSDTERDIAVRVPRVSTTTAPDPAPPRRVINVHRDGQLSLDRKTVNADELLAELTAARQTRKDLGVVVRGDAEGAFQNVATVLNICRRAGIGDLGISVNMTPATVSRGGTTRR
jgi:biopolymer transport protein ExbD